ncbi:hypothetical protein [Flyfo podovirus Tbat2_2]|nr:hypothetical protein [Flyfo podovirus Tbat2_2]
MSKQTFVTDVYRLVAGSFADQNTTDHEGRALAPEKYNWWAGLAIPKTPGIMDWKQETGNATLMAILKAGQEAFPNGEWIHPNFSWKIQDGDNFPDRVGYAGHWIVGFSRNTQIGPVPCYDQICATIQPMMTKKGWSYRVSGSSVGNGRTGNQAGVYVNMEMVQLCIANPDDVIVTGPSAQSVFGAFGNGQQQAPVTQQQAPVTQQQAPVTQQQAPVTQQQAPVTQQQALSLTPAGQGIAPTIEALKAMMPTMSEQQLITAGFVTVAAPVTQQQTAVLVITDQGKAIAPTIEALKAMMPTMSEDQLVQAGFAVKTTPAPGFLAGNGQYA